MTLRSQSICLVSLVFSLISVGASTAKAIAQTTYPFDVVYSTEVILTPIPSTDVSKGFVSGFNSDAPYPAPCLISTIIFTPTYLMCN